MVTLTSEKENQISEAFGRSYMKLIGCKPSWAIYATVII
jgi:hypothetical protein